VRVLAWLRRVWGTATTEAARRLSAHPVANLYVQLAEDVEPEQAQAELMRRLRPRLLPGQQPTRATEAAADQQALVALFEAWRKAEHHIAEARLSEPLAAAVQRFAPAPTGWETANQQALEEDVRVALIAFWPALSNAVGPWEARDAASASERAAAAKKRGRDAEELARELPETPDPAPSPAERHEAESERLRAYAILDSLPKAAAARRAFEAMLEGASKSAAAETAGLSRPTLDKYLKILREHYRPE
jgi:hypothetical protein